jgi:membrane-associated protease RseP (regulator of RpoE activity)
MEIVRWHSIVAAVILMFGATPLRAQNPLEQLEAKLMEQEKINSQKAAELKRSPTSEPFEKLPPPANSPKKSLLVDPPIPLLFDSPSNASVPSISEPSTASAERLSASEPVYVGMTLERPRGGGMGLRVVEVVQQSPAWKSGFQIDDRILAIGGIAISDIDVFADEIAKFAPNDRVKFLVERRGRQMEVNVVLIAKSFAARTLSNTTNRPDEAPLAGDANQGGETVTPQYVQRLEAELEELRTELRRSQIRIQSLENALNRVPR